MKRWKATARVFLIIMGVTATAVACGGGSTEPRHARGVVKSVDAGARKVTLDHGNIPGLMKAMTMTFEVAPGVELGDLQEGAKVEFWVKEDAGTYTVTRIRRPAS